LLGAIITGSSLIFLLTFVLLKKYGVVNISDNFVPLVHLLLIILIGLIYRQKYVMRLSKELILKTSIYSSLFVLSLFSLIGIFLAIIKQFTVGGIFILIGLIVTFANFIFVSVNLNISNLINLDSILQLCKETFLFKRMHFELLQNEKVLLHPKRTTLKRVMFYLIILVILSTYQYFIGNKISRGLGGFSEVITNLIILFLAVEIIDTFFLSDFILTNKRIIIKRYLIYREILLSEVESLNSHQIRDYGYLTILMQNGVIFRSTPIANPDSVKIEIDKILKPLI